MGELINGRTAEEIKASLIMCAENECDVYICPYRDDGEMRCSDFLMTDTLALIERLEAERDAALEKVPRWISSNCGAQMDAEERT